MSQTGLVCMATPRIRRTQPAMHPTYDLAVGYSCNHPPRSPCSSEFRVWHDQGDTYLVMYEKVRGYH